MLVEAFLRTRTDRVIAAGRAAIAVFALAAIWVDPSQPTVAPELAYGLLVAYLAFAAGVLLALQRENAWSAEIALGSHVADLAVISALMFLTEGPTSPFFLLFTFSLLSASFRWQWKGALWTAVAVLILLVVIAATTRAIAPALPFETDRFIIRTAHVVVIGAMLVYFGFRQQRSAEEAARFAAWQPKPADVVDSRSVLSACLAHAGNVFAAPRAVLVLQPRGESWTSCSVWENGTFQPERISAGTLEMIVPKTLAESGFIRRVTGDVLVADGHGGLSLWHGTVSSPWLSEHGLERVLSVPVHSEHATGRLFVAAKRDFAREELTLASLVAAQIGNLLDRLQAIEAAQRATVMEDRLRLARDLHDGVLQTLSATALQLETIRRLADQDPASVPGKINDMQSWLLNEQREMRAFIGKLRPLGLWARSGLVPEQSDLPALVKALEQQWGVAIGLPFDVADLELPADLEFHARQIIREAVANAARHGGATDVSVRAESIDHRLNLLIADNGRGLPAHGRFDERQSAECRIGPRSLRERVVSLGGSLVIESSPSGLTLAIDLPLRSTNATSDGHSDR